METQELKQAVVEGLNSLRDDLRSEVVGEVTEAFKSRLDPIEDKLAKLERPNIEGNGTPEVDPLAEPEGSIRIYKSGESIYKDRVAVTRDAADKVTLGQFLRSVVQAPRTEAETRLRAKSLDSGSFALPAHIAAEFIDRLRADNVLIQAGARSVVLEDGSTHYLKVVSDPTATFEPGLNTQNETQPNFGAVEFSPKTVRAWVEVSREALQDVRNIESMLTASFVGALNAAILDALFTDQGVAFAPVGLDTQITATETYANGGAPTWGTFIAARRQLRANNVDRFSIVAAPDVEESLDSDADTTGQFIVPPKSFENVPFRTNSAVPAGVAYVGRFEDLLFGWRLDPFMEQVAQDASRFSAFWLAAARLDVAALRPASFVRIQEGAA